MGFNTAYLAYENIERSAGETKWSFFSLARYAIDGIVAFSTAPLAIASACGGVLCVVALIGAIFIIVRAALFGDAVTGWPSLAALITLLGGMQLLCLGIMGQYLAKTYLETKRRPIYLLRASSDDDGEQPQVSGQDLSS